MRFRTFLIFSSYLIQLIPFPSSLGRSLSLSLTSVGSVDAQIAVSGATGAGYIIEGSTNLTEWFPLSTNRPSDLAVRVSRDLLNAEFYRARSRGAIQTVFIMMMENIDWTTFVGNSTAPYLNSLLPQYSHADNYRSFGHPSLPNYTYLEAGANLGLTDGSWLPGPAHSQTTTDHLTSYLFKNGISWKAYQENMPGGGTVVPLVDGGGYSLDHNPFVYFYDVTGNPTNVHNAYGIDHIRPYETEFYRDLTNDAVAAYNFIVPNDFHQGEKTTPPLNNGVKQADAWLQEEIPKIIASEPYQNGGVIFILWDEGYSPANNPSGCIVVSKFAKAGYANSIAYSHASMVRTIQTIFDVQPFLRNAATATDLSDLFSVFP